MSELEGAQAPVTWLQARLDAPQRGETEDPREVRSWMARGRLPPHLHAACCPGDFTPPRVLVISAKQPGCPVLPSTALVSAVTCCTGKVLPLASLCSSAEPSAWVCCFGLSLFPLVPSSLLQSPLVHLYAFRCQCFCQSISSPACIPQPAAFRTRER